MVRKALFWSFSGQFLTMLATFLGSIVIARLLSPKEMGIYAVAMAAIGVLQLFAAFGVGAYIVRETELTPQKLDAAFTINLLLSLLLALLIFGLGTFGAYLLEEPAVAPVLQLLALTPILSAFSFRPSVMLQRGMLFRGASIIAAAGATIAAGVTITAALLGASAMSPAYGSVLSSLFSTIALLAIGREHFSVRVSLFEWRKITLFGLRLMSIGGVSQAAVRLSDIVVAKSLGLAALGLYSRAINLNNLIFSNIYGTATRVVFVQLSEAQRDGDRVSEVFLRGLRMIIGFVGPILIGLAVLANPAMLILYGRDWLGAAVPLALILVAQFISLAFAMNWELFVVRDELKIQTRLEIARSISGVTTVVIGSMISLNAVAAGSIVAAIFSLFLYSRHMPRLAGVDHSHMLRLYGEGCLLTGIATLPSFGLMLATGWDSATSIPLILGAIALGALGWLWLLRHFNHPLMHEIELMAARLQGRMKSRGRAGAAE